MRNALLSVGVVLLLIGCGSKASSQGQAVPANSEVPQAARAGHRVDLGLDTRHTSQLSDRDLVELRSQLHNETLSNIAAMKLLKDMQEAEDAARMEAGLMEAPLTPEQKIARLAAIRKALDEVRARETEAAKKQPESGK